MKAWCYEPTFSNDLQLQSRQSKFDGKIGGHIMLDTL